MAYNCHFIKFLNNDTSYTTANELGFYLISRGIKFKQFSDDSLSCHFGTVFNQRLISGIKKNPLSINYSYKDFPKLLVDVNNNNTIIQQILNLNMCQTTSIAKVNKDSDVKALDLYTIHAVNCLVASYGLAVNTSDYTYALTIDTEADFQVNTRKITNNKSQEGIRVPFFVKG